MVSGVHVVLEPAGHIDLDPYGQTRPGYRSPQSRTAINGHVVFGSNNFRSPIPRGLCLECTAWVLGPEHPCSAHLQLQRGRPGAAAARRHRVVVAHPLRHRAATWAAENGRSELAGRLHHYAEGRVAATWAARSGRCSADRDRRVHWSHGPVGGGKSADRMTGSRQCRRAGCGLRGTRNTGRPCRRALASPARHGIRTVPRRRGGSRMPAPGRYQRPWITVPLCSVTTFLALPVQSMKAGRSCQVSRASLQCSTTPAGDA